MSEELTISDPVERRRAWLGKLTAELLKLEPLFPVHNFLLDEGLPQWVHNLEREIGATMFPLVRLKEEPTLSPKRIGGLIGHSCAYAVWMMEYLEEQMSEPEQDTVSKLTPEQIALAEKYLLGIANDWYPALRRFAKRALCSSVDQSYEDMTEFLLGFSQAFSRKPRRQNASDIGNSATQIYFFMFIWWRAVKSMQSVHQLHQWLVKAFHPHRIGDLKRIEKMCQRIELHYRKPGRPKKSK
jgi:hypothetical protein